MMNTGMTMRILHRYLGFFLAGIMAVYALSGVVLIFRNTDFLKHVEIEEKTIEPQLEAAAIGQALRIRDFKISKKEGDWVYFKRGKYNIKTGAAELQVKKLPYILGKMTKLHKANSNSPLFFLNIFFGLALLFFVVSAFWMFRPATSIFKKGLYFTLGGMVLTLILLFV